MLKDYLLCYDISDHKRLYRTRKICYPLSLGGQKSALHTPLTKAEAKKVLNKLLKIIKEKEDKINIIEIDPEPIILGRGLPLLFDKGAIII